MKKLLCVLLILFITTISFSSLATTNNKSWTCPNCNRVVTTNFCPDCGIKRPETKTVPSSTPNTETIKISKAYFQIKNLYFLGERIMLKKADQVRQVLLPAGFVLEYADTTGFADHNVYRYKSKEYPYYLSLFVDKKTGITNLVEYAFAPSKSNYINLYQSLNLAYGPPTISTHKKYWCETAFWYDGKNITYRLFGDNWSGVFPRDKCSLSTIEKGKHAFSLVLMNDSSPISTAEPTPVPTPKPTSAPKIGNDISISSVKLGKNLINSPELYIVFRNNTSSTIDRLDFNITCYDAYGRQILGFGYYYSENCFYDDKIRPNGKSSSSTYWTLYGYEGTKSVEIAITAYHTTNGKTIRIPESLWVYHHYKF